MKGEMLMNSIQVRIDYDSAGFDEMARDEARHGKAFEGLLKRYFGK